MRPTSLAAVATLSLVLLGCPEAEEQPQPPATEAPEPDPEPDPDPDPEPDEAEEGAWEELPEAPIAGRFNHTTTWADGLVIVWGGQDQDAPAIADDGAAYDPVTREWQQIPAAPIEGRWAHEAVWSGEELIVWGGTAGPDHLADCYDDGARYDPAAGEWQAIPEAPGDRRCAAAVVWADDELLVFGGHRDNGPPGPGDRFDDGLAYDPATDQWRELPPAPLEPRAGAIAVWTGNELIVYGGHTQADAGEGFEYLTDGAAYDPATEQWRPIEDAPLPPRAGQHGVWVGDELVVLGGDDPDPDAAAAGGEAAAYDPADDSWSTLADDPWPEADYTPVLADDVVYLLGSGSPDPGPDEETPEDPPAFAAYLIEEDQWIERPDPPDGPRMHHDLAWTGAQLVVWGGQAQEEPADGILWDPPA